jgi:hypothetical protein
MAYWKEQSLSPCRRAMQELSPSSHSIRDKTEDESTKGNLGPSNKLIAVSS